MKKLHHITITGAASYIYDILQKSIEILLTKEVMILEIGQSKSRDKNGNEVVFLTMIYRKKITGSTEN